MQNFSSDWMMWVSSDFGRVVFHFCIPSKPSLPFVSIKDFFSASIQHFWGRLSFKLEMFGVQNPEEASACLLFLTVILNSN